MDVRQKRRELLDKAASQGISPDERDLLDALNTIQQVQGSVEQHPEIVRARQEANRIQADRAFELICRVNYNGKRLQNRIANRNAVFAWHDESRDGIVNDIAAWFVKCLNENPALANTVTWEPADPAVRQRAAEIQAEQDRQMAQAICYEFDLALNEANIRLLIEQAKEGTWDEVKTFIRSNLLDGVVRASQEELNERAQAAAQARTQFLKTKATPQELREAAKQETAETFETARQKELARQLELAKSRHDQRGFPLLPPEYTKQVIKAMSAAEFRRLIQRFGDYQISSRINEAA